MNGYLMNQLTMNFGLKINLGKNWVLAFVVKPLYIG